MLETDVTKMLRYNFEHSRKWHELSQLRGVPVIYASSSALYGRTRVCRVDDAAGERPFNAYGSSKLVLDRWVQANLESLKSQVHNTSIQVIQEMMINQNEQRRRQQQQQQQQQVGPGGPVGWDCP